MSAGATAAMMNETQCGARKWELEKLEGKNKTGCGVCGDLACGSMRFVRAVLVIRVSSGYASDCGMQLKKKFWAS